MSLPANRDQIDKRVSVLVVGAGPTGLLLASELHRRGVDCHLIEARPAPLPWDRATIVHPRSMQIFEALGLSGKFLEAGCRQRSIKIHSNGKVLGTIDLSACGSTYEFNLGISEETTESILTDYLHQQGGEVNRSSRLVGLTPHANGVLAEVDCDGHRYQVDARRVVGCDGIHSLTRELSGIHLEGHDIANPWAVFDATLQGWTDTFETIFVYFGAVPTIFTAIPGHRWRVYLQTELTGLRSRRRCKLGPPHLCAGSIFRRREEPDNDSIATPKWPPNTGRDRYFSPATRHTSAHPPRVTA